MQKTIPLLHFLTLHRSLLSSFAHPPIHFHRLKNDCEYPGCFITKKNEKVIFYITKEYEKGEKDEKTFCFREFRFFRMFSE